MRKHLMERPLSFVGKLLNELLAVNKAPAVCRMEGFPDSISCDQILAIKIR
jgi:hypothetical protein